VKITKVEAWPVTMRLTAPYEIAYETVEETVNVFLRLETDSPLVGYGCAAPDAMVTGETPETVLETIRGNADAVLHGADPLRRAVLLEELCEAARKEHPSALAAVDMALHDLLGKIAGLPLWQLLGGYRESIVTSVTVGILNERETVEAAREHIARGFRCLKLKGGRDAEADAAIVRSEHVGSSPFHFPLLPVGRRGLG